MIDIKPKYKTAPYFEVNIKDYKGKDKKIDVDGYLLGILAAIKAKKDRKWHGLVLVTGSVGDGKSTMIECLAGLDAMMNNSKFTLDEVSWKTETFIENTDREDNIGTPQWWDEAIQGASARNMAITNVGNKLKMAFVTKRFKRHTYFLAIDEIKEYAPKLVEMADCWIHIRHVGLERGYFDVYTYKSKMQFLYNAFKFYNKTWRSKEVRMIKPDKKGCYMDFSETFLDSKLYNKRKMEETRQSEAKDDIKSKVILGLRDYGLNNKEIGNIIGLHPDTVQRNWKKLTSTQRS